jgi:RNA polymerase sigma-70 factor (ECF subfamily)
MGDDLEQLLQKRSYQQAFQRLLDLYSSKVLRMAVVLLKDDGRAEEVTQDIFLKIWRTLPDFDGRAAVSTWLYTIARNTCLSALRSESYRKTMPLDRFPEPTVPNTAPRDIALDQGLSRLSEVQREVIMLFYFEDRTVDEVAQMLDLPIGTVKSHLHRARRALSEMLE